MYNTDKNQKSQIHNIVILFGRAVGVIACVLDKIRGITQSPMDSTQKEIKQDVKPSIPLTMIWYAIMLMRRRCNVNMYSCDELVHIILQN